jgi:hypothetical protein
MSGELRGAPGVGVSARGAFSSARGIVPVMDDRRRAVSLVFGLLLLAWATVEVLAGGSTGLLYAAPTLLLALPLAHGLYPAEERLHGLAGRRCTHRRRPLRVQPPRSLPRQVDRGGRLVGRALAKRPPPRPAFRPLAP